MTLSKVAAKDELAGHSWISDAVNLPEFILVCQGFNQNQDWWPQNSPVLQSILHMWSDLLPQTWNVQIQIFFSGIICKWCINVAATHQKPAAWAPFNNPPAYIMLLTIYGSLTQSPVVVHLINSNSIQQVTAASSCSQLGMARWVKEEETGAETDTYIIDANRKPREEIWFCIYTYRSLLSRSVFYFEGER